MKVRATEKGLYGDSLRFPGDEFEIDPPHKATWFEPVEDEKPKRGRPRKSEKTEEAPE